MKQGDGSVMLTKRIMGIDYNKRDFETGIFSKYLDRLGQLRIKIMTNWRRGCFPEDLSPVTVFHCKSTKGIALITTCFDGFLPKIQVSKKVG